MTGTIKTLPLPTASQVEWADAEIGVIIHLDVQVFEPDYSFRKQWGYTPDPKVFNPRSLDTDQWIKTAKATGAKYAVLVAKHCSGFSLWPTKAHSYSVAASPWKNGRGDIVGDFFKSCVKYGVRPGLYCSAACNAFMNVDNPGKVRSGEPTEQKRYNEAVEMQLTELWSNYGKMFEIWFDGGVVLPEDGGPDIIPIMKRLQPDAVVFQGPPDWPSLLRFVGNERGEAPDPFWNTTNDLSSDDGTVEKTGLGGNPEGCRWVPGETDMPNRGQKNTFQGGWFWREGDDKFLYSLDHLTECYFTSVARNTNLLLGMVIDNRGLVPEPDCKRFAEFGQQIRKIFSNCLGKTQGEGKAMTLSVPAGKTTDMLVIMEDIAHGERIRKYVVEALVGSKWLKICEGTCVGHKRIERFDPIKASEIRLIILECVGIPQLREFSAWMAEENLFSVPLNPALRSKLFITRDKDGYVNIRSSNPNLSIRYTVDGSEPDGSSPVFRKPFLLRDGGTVKAYSFINDECRSAVETVIFGVDRSLWKVVSVSLDSPFKNGGCAGVEFLLNDDPTTYWHTYHNDKSKSAPPHEVILDMGKKIEVTGFTLMPRNAEGAPDQYEFHLSRDGKSWELAAAGRFDDLNVNQGMRSVHLAAAKSSRYIRFVAKHVVDDGDYVVVAGIGVIAENT
jgi:alpha-L-fucosidase